MWCIFYLLKCRFEFWLRSLSVRCGSGSQALGPHNFHYYLLFLFSFFPFFFFKCSPAFSTPANVRTFFLSLFFCLSRQPSVLSALLLIFIFPQDFNCFVLPLSCPTIVSAPIMSVCGFTAWLQGVDSRILFQATHMLCSAALKKMHIIVIKFTASFDIFIYFHLICPSC